MTNETTASQPKSIGDDAQFWAELSLVRLSKTAHEQIKRAEDFLVPYLDSKLIASAAQASATIQAEGGVDWLGLALALEDRAKTVESQTTERSMAAAARGLRLMGAATIQAAPEGYALVPLVMNPEMMRVVEDEGWTWEDLLGAAAAITDEQYATIQEPVMVAEPVAYADPMAFLNFTSGSATHEWMWANPDAGLVPLYLAAPMVADPAGVARPAGYLNKEGFLKLALGEMAEIYPVESGSDGKTPVYFAATVKAVPSEALTAIHGLIAVAGAAYHLMDNTEESGPVGASVFKHQEDDNAYLTEALDQLDALPDNQPGYVMGPCAKAEWALRHILADKTSGGE